MTRVECPECGERFETPKEVLYLFHRLACSACDALLEVIEEDPLLLDVVEEEYEEDDILEDDEWGGE